PLHRPQERAVLPLPYRIARAMENHRLSEEALHRLPHVVLPGRGGREAAAPALVVRKHPVQGHPVPDASGGVDADRALGIALPGEIALAGGAAMAEAGVRIPIPQISLEHLRGACEILGVLQIY